MKLIPLTKNKFAQVDDEDFELLNQYKWHFNSGYAERKEYRDGKQIHISMHRELLKTPKDKYTDHINGNTLDNRKENLRVVTRSQNAMNMKSMKSGSIYKGITKVGNNWRIQIWKDNKRVFNTTAPTELMGALIYDLNAPALFGEYAKLNFPNAFGSEVKTAGALHG